MATTITVNRKNTSAVLHYNSSGNTIVAGNSSTSNIATGNEVITGATITQVYWGCDGNGHIQVKRAGNLVGVYDSTGYKDYAGCGMPLNVNPTANIEVSFVGSANAYLMIEVQKSGTFTSEYLVG